MKAKTFDTILKVGGATVVASILFAVIYQVVLIQQRNAGNYSLPELSFLPVMGLLLFLLPVYFLPTLIVAGRRHVGIVAVLNLLFGWTVIVWLGCLAVAIFGQPKTR